MGDIESMYHLGYLYSQSQAPLQNTSLAIHWYSLASGKGHVEAMFNLGLLHDKEDDSQIRTAAEWYLMAANQGHPRAQYNLALIILRGDLNVERFGTARKLLQLAAEQNFEEARIALEALKK